MVACITVRVSKDIVKNKNLSKLMVLLYLNSDDRDSGTMDDATYDVRKLGFDVSEFKQLKVKVVAFSMENDQDASPITIQLFGLGTTRDCGSKGGVIALGNIKASQGSSSVVSGVSHRQGPMNSPFLNIKISQAAHEYEIILQVDIDVD